MGIGIISNSGSSGSGEPWAVSYCKAMETVEKTAEVCGQILAQQNKTSEGLLKKMGEYSDGKSEVVTIQGLLVPDPDDKGPKDPTLKDKGIKQEQLDPLNDILHELGLPPVTLDWTKSKLEGLQARLTGMQETASGQQSMQSSKMNLYLNRIQTAQQMISNLLRQMATVEQNYGRNTGPI